MNFVVDAVEQFIAEMWSMLIFRPAQQNVGVAEQADGARDVGELGVHKTLAWLEQLTHLFWPAGGERECSDTIANVLSTLIAEVSFRFLLAHREEPYLSCGIKGQAPTDGQVQRAFNTLRSRPSCVDGIMVLLEYSLAPDASGVSAADRYRVAHGQWNLRCEPTNIPREKLHAEQRFQSKKTDRHPTTYARQAATSVACCVSRLKYFRGGRSLEHATQDRCEDFKASVILDGRAVHSRPRQTGNPLFSWVSERLQAICVLLLLLLFCLFGLTFSLCRKDLFLDDMPWVKGLW